MVNQLANGTTSGTIPTFTPIVYGTESIDQLPVVTPVLIATITPPAVSTATPSATETTSTVTISAAKGNLFIRRGPDLAFNPVSVLMNGQSANALARDVLAKWVQIPIPGRTEDTGWVSIQTQFSRIDGDVMSLPEILPTYWPVLAFLRNCTYHQMEVEPGDMVIPPLNAFPDNRMQINPGVYTVHDIDVDGSPEVLSVNMREGVEIDIRQDGAGFHKKCPIP